MRAFWSRSLSLVVLFLLASGGLLSAQGPITLAVDASETTRKILHARETIPVQPGPLTLLYPKWIPGEHAPNGPINSLVDLHFTVAGKPIPWQRDPLDNYTFHCEIPAGADQLEITLDDVLPVGGGLYSSGLSATAQLTLLSWNQLLLYPAGVPSDRLTYQAQLKLPAGWKFGTRAADARNPGRHHAIRAGFPDHAGGFAAGRRGVLPAHFAEGRRAEQRHGPCRRQRGGSGAA